MQRISILLIISVIYTMAFVPSPSRFVRPSLETKSSAALSQWGKKKEAVAVVDTNNFWEGDWVCADCGYVYDIDYDGGGLYFEQQKKGFICPQCSAPRRRYAKAVGDQWGITNDGGDFPIYAMTFAGLVLTTWFSLVVVPSL